MFINNIEKENEQPKPSNTLILQEALNIVEKPLVFIQLYIILGYT